MQCRVILPVLFLAVLCLLPAVTALNEGLYIGPSGTTLSIASSPSGATVVLDGVTVGTTPYSTHALSAGQHSVILKKQGFEDYTTDVVTVTGTPVSKTYTLNPVVTTTPIPFSPIRIIPFTTTTVTETPTPSQRLIYRPGPAITVQSLVTPPVQQMPTRPPPAPSGVQRVSVEVPLCQYDKGTGQCTGTCPLTGSSCQIIKTGACSSPDNPGAIACGCVNPRSRLSLLSSGLATRPVVVSHYAYSPPPASNKGIVASITGFFSRIINIVANKPDISTADPRAYTWETNRGIAARAEGICINNSIPTVLDFTNSSYAFINMEEGMARGWFEWDSADPRVRSAVWQVSVFPFPVSRSNWSEVPGLVAEGNLDGDQRQFSIDFSKSVPKSGDVARIWADRKPYLSMEKNILAAYKTSLASQAKTPAGPLSAAAEARRLNQLAGADSAIATINQKIARPPSLTFSAPAKNAVSMANIVSLAGNQPGTGKGSHINPGSVAPPGSYTINAEGVAIPNLDASIYSKDQIAGTLPQVQRTFYVRVVPFDFRGNYTGNPSNTKEVIVGEPVLRATGPWSGWNPLASVDQSGFTNPPEMVYFNDRLYLFNVQNDHQVSVNSVDKNGAVSGWTVVPGSVRTSENPAVVVYPVVEPGPPQWLYIFVSNMNTNTIWYTKMDKNGNWNSGWTEVPHQDIPYAQYFHHPFAAADHNGIYLTIKTLNSESAFYSLVMTGQGTNELWSAKPNMEYSMWGSGLVFNYVGSYQGDSGQGNLVGYAKFDSPYAGHAGYLSLWSHPVGLIHANDPMSSNSMKQISDPIYIPSDITDGTPGFNDVASARYHDRLYFFVRGKQGRIYMAWIPIMPVMLGSGLGEFHGWDELSPGMAAGNPGISSIVTLNGDRLALFANDISSPSSGALSGMDVRLLDGTPDSTRLLESDWGTRTVKTTDVTHTEYREKNVNISWNRQEPFYFAWNSSRPDLLYAEWQVSMTPFDETRPRFDDPGIVTRGRLNINDTDPDRGYNGGGEFMHAFPSYIDYAHVFPLNFADFAIPGDPNNPSVTRYYLRVVTVVPLGIPGQYQAFASRQTEVDWSPPVVFTPTICVAPTYTEYEYPLPSVKIVGYTPIHPRPVDNPECYGIVTTGHEYWAQLFGDSIASMLVGNHKNGEHWYLCNPPEHHWYDTITDFFGLIWNFFEEIVDGVANAWNSVKGAVISGVCGGNRDCEGWVSAGVDIALAAEGIPPTLPNFDELMHDGVDYLAATVATEYGVPDEITKDAMNQMYDSLQHVPNHDDNYGIQPDPDYLYQPARLEIELTNNNPDNPTLPGSFTLRDAAGLFRTQQPDIAFPAVPPGKTIRFPLVLKEDQWEGVTCADATFNFTESCDTMFYGQINQAWWDQYKSYADVGDTFTIRYAGLPQKMVTNLTEQMSTQYNLPFNNYVYQMWGLQQPGCMAPKYGLVFEARTSDGKLLYQGFYGQEPLDTVTTDSLENPWSA
jgi:PEGA domain